MGLVSISALVILMLASVTPSARAADAYVTNFGSENISVIDTQTNAVVGTPIKVGVEPELLAITPDGKTAYVVNWGSNNVSMVNTETNKVIGSPISVGVHPVSIAITPDGKTAYVTNFNSNTVSVINTETNKVIGSPISVGGGPWVVAITPNGKTAYVANAGTDNVSVIDTQTNKVVGTPIGVGTNPVGIAITPNGDFAYVTNFSSKDVSVINTQTNEVVGTPIVVGTEPEPISITPDGKTAYVLNWGSNNVSVINIQTNELVGAPIVVGTKPVAVTITPDGKTAYVTNYGSNTVSVLDTRTNEVIGTPIVVGTEPNGVAIPPDQPPTASFSASSARLGSPTTFDASASGDPDGSIASYDWEFGDGSMEEGSNSAPNHTYSSSGTYDATLTLTDNEGCSTEFIFTGQTAYCNGSALARQTQPVRVTGAATGVVVSLLPEAILPNESSTTTATATVTDANGNPAPGQSISLSSSDEGEKIGPVSEPSEGTYTAQVTSSKNVGTATITATDTSVNPSVAGSAMLTQTFELASHLALALQPGSILANGAATSMATATVTNANGNPSHGQNISFSSTDPGERFGPVNEPTVGTYTAQVTASKTAGTATITATNTSVNPSVVGSAALVQTPGPATHLALALQPGSILANGAATSTATATVTDANGNPATGQSISFSSTDEGEKFGPVSEPSEGTYTAQVTASKTAGTATITATDTSVNPSVVGSAALVEISPGLPAKTPPIVSITEKPSEKTRERRPSFSFVSDQPGSTFQCRLGDREFQLCRSPHSLTKLSFGGHVFGVRAINQAGEDGASVSYRFLVSSSRRVQGRARRRAPGTLLGFARVF